MTRISLVLLTHVVQENHLDNQHSECALYDDLNSNTNARTQVRETKSRTCGDNGRSTPIGSGFDDETSGIVGVCFGDVGMDQVYVMFESEAREFQQSLFFTFSLRHKNFTCIAHSYRTKIS